MWRKEEKGKNKNGRVEIESVAMKLTPGWIQWKDTAGWKARDGMLHLLKWPLTSASGARAGADRVKPRQ
jgi:hypothetical protein